MCNYYGPHIQPLKPQTTLSPEGTRRVLYMNHYHGLGKYPLYQYIGPLRALQALNPKPQTLNPRP